MQERPIRTFGDILNLRADGTDRWIGPTGPGVGKRLFGGHTLAQGLMAAALSEQDERLPHSLHAHFLHLGRADRETRFDVSTLKEGRSFATRRVEAWQDDSHVLSMTVSFQIEESGFTHSTPPPDVADVSTARQSLEDWKARQADFDELPILGRLWERPIETIPVDVDALFGDTPRAPASASWMRVRESAPVGPAMARAQLAYASDMLFLRNSLLPHGVRPGARNMQIASLDHAIWFHRAPDFGEWHLYATESPWAGGARGLNRGHFFAQDGTLVATVAQENLMRVLDQRPN